VVRWGVNDFWGKVSKILLFGIILLIPTQLGKHFWFDWSSVLGIRIDYFAPTVYLIDVMFLLFLVVSLINGDLKRKKVDFGWLWVLILIGINILIAANKWVAVYKWVRLGELFWFGWYVYKNKKLVKDFLVKIIPIWIVVESILALGQIAKGGSLDGWWWFLGERKFDFNTIGIAKISIMDMGLVRAYGTFSHPNSLAGFLLVCLVWWIKYKSLSAVPLLPLTKGRLLVKKIWWWGVFWMGLMGIFLSGSRMVWILTLGVIVFWINRGGFTFKTKVKFGLLFLVLSLILIKIIDFNYPLENFLGGWDENGIMKRGQLNLAAIEMIRESPWVGIGLGNYLVRLPNFLKTNHIFWLQPVHNIFLLLVSEIGILGLMVVVWLLAKIKWNKLTEWDWVILVVILMTGMVDHYWFTLPQNMWLLALILGVI
jgi:hypothetical protein